MMIDSKRTLAAIFEISRGKVKSKPTAEGITRMKARRKLEKIKEDKQIELDHCIWL